VKSDAEEVKSDGWQVQKQTSQIQDFVLERAAHLAWSFCGQKGTEKGAMELGSCVRPIVRLELIRYV
jgi:hypothetical protein